MSSAHSAASDQGRRGFVGRLLPEPGPARLLVMNSFMSTVGYGMYVAGGAIYFTQLAGLSAVQVGIGLSVAGLVCLPLSVPTGHLADRLGPREVTIGFGAAQAVLLVAATSVRSFWVFLLVICMLGVAEQGANVSRGALVAAVVGREGRVRLSAHLRSVANVGLTVGIALAGLVLVIGTRPAYLALLLGNAAGAAVVAANLTRLPRVDPVPRKVRASPWSAVRDVPYAAVAALCGAATIADTVLAVGIPLWVVRHTDAPPSLAALLLLTNTGMVVALQVRASRGVDDPAPAGRLLRRACLLVAVSCAVLGLAGGLPVWGASAALLLGVVVLTAGELYSSAAAWALRFGLAPQDQQGAYGGLFSMGSSVRAVAGPAVVVALTDRWLLAGWLVLAGGFVVLAMAAAPLVGWAVGTRPPDVTPGRRGAAAAPR